MGRDAQAVAEQLQGEFDVLHYRLDLQRHVAESQRLSEHAQEAAREVIDGVERLRSGDQLGGAAALLRGLGQLAGFASLAGPAGAIFGSALSALTDIIGAILEAFEPEKLSLEEKIDQLLTKHALKEHYVALKTSEDCWQASGMITLLRLANGRDLVSQAVAAGASTDDEIKSWIDRFNAARSAERKPKVECFFPEGKPLKAIAEGVSWEYLRANVRYQDSLDAIQLALNALQDNPGPYLEWQYLCEQVVGYMYRMYVALHALGGVVDAKGVDMFEDQLNATKKQYHDALVNLSFPAKNSATVYHIWQTSAEPHYRYEFSNNMNSLMSRFGLTGSETGLWEEVPGFSACSTFAISSRGTVFAVTGDNTPGAGRGSFRPARGAQEAEQIFIGEIPGSGDVIVGVTHAKGRSFSVCAFNDLPGGDWEDNEEEWTPNEKRWGDWGRHDVAFRILAGHIEPQVGGTYGILLLGLNSDDSVTLYKYGYSDGAVKIPFFTWSNANARAYFRKAFDISNLLSLTPFEDCRWEGPFPCAISTAGALLAVQFGNQVKVRSPGEPDAIWDLQDMLGLGELTVYRGRFFGQLAFAASTSQGFHYRYWDGEERVMRWAHNKDFDSVDFTIVPNGMLDRLEALLADSKTPIRAD